MIMVCHGVCVEVRVPLGVASLLTSYVGAGDHTQVIRLASAFAN